MELEKLTVAVERALLLQPKVKIIKTAEIGHFFKPFSR